MTTAWEYLLNGSLIQAAYQAYNIPFTFGGVQNYPIGFIYIVFIVLLYIQVRDITYHFVVSLILFSIFFLFIPGPIKTIALIILALELAGVIYNLVTE
jgi:hypothetical protein